MSFVRQLILGGCAGLLSFAAFGATNAQPNIVLILMDNYGYGEPGVYGGGIVRGAPSPRIDQLAAEGLRLTNYNVEAQCTPSRAALLTGRYAVRTGNGSVPLSTPLYGLTQWEVTIAESLSAKGYATAAYGKWHLGQTAGRFPTDQGFDEWYGIPNSTDESFWAGQPGVDGKSIHPFSRPEYIYEGKRGAVPQEVKVYDLEQRRLIDGESTRRGIDFMRRQSKAGKPFFLYMPMTQTHYPTLPSPEFKGKTGNGDYADSLVQADAYVGRLLDAVDQLGIRDNTIFIFTSDNGPEMFLPNIGSSGPWRGTYFTGLEGSLRVPFIVRWPGKVPAGGVSNEIVHQMDVFPTLAHIVGADVPQDRIIDGMDLSDFMLGKTDKSKREGFVVYVGNDLFGVKWHNWKIMSKEVGTGYGEPIRSYGVPLFYNLLTDPKEEHPADPRTLESLWVRFPAFELLGEHMKSIMKEPPIRPGTPDPYQAK
ncbi:MAG: arylsulfatase [Rhodocyclaceae bacterium]|nr:arylsulfatase [Rhodocyclaceae bacterium]